MYLLAFAFRYLFIQSQVHFFPHDREEGAQVRCQFCLDHRYVKITL